MQYRSDPHQVNRAEEAKKLQNLMDKYLNEHQLLSALFKLETRIFPCMDVNTAIRIS